MYSTNTRNYTFSEKVSLKPNQVTLYNEVLFSTTDDNTLRSIHSGSRGASISKAFHNFEISKNASRTMQQKIQWLYSLSTPRTIKTYSGKDIYKFKLNFFTLTLPSTQKDASSIITNTCFNQFLTEIRQRTNMKNYVWRLEFQKNNNVHYHIVTDTYLDYFFLQKVWNRCINKLKYVDVYREKFSKMTLHQYWAEQSKNTFSDFQVYKKRFEKGVACGWTKPSTVDVKVCRNENEIASYMSKYFSKKEENKNSCNPLDTEENSFSLRLWFCSRSLSKLKSINDYTANVKINYYELMKDIKNVRTLVLEYATCIFFDIDKQSKYIATILKDAFKNYALSQDYSSA